jgi:hypothetical protein
LNREDGRIGEVGRRKAEGRDGGRRTFGGLLTPYSPDSLLGILGTQNLIADWRNGVGIKGTRMEIRLEFPEYFKATKRKVLSEI